MTPAELPHLPLTAADVGRRVSLRSLRLPGSPFDASDAFDTVGVLRSVEPGRVGVERRDGSVVALGWPPHPSDSGLSPVVAGRVVPPEVSAIDLQRIAQRGWPPRESCRLGDWELRWSDSGGRSDSARVGVDPGMPLPEALAAASDWYRARGATPLLQVPRPALTPELSALGWVVSRSVALMTAPNAAPTRPEVDGLGTAQALELVHAPVPDDEWLGLLHDDEPFEAASKLPVLLGPTHVTFLSARDPDTGTLVGIGRASAAQGWSGITSIVVAPRRRRQGVASRLTAELRRWGASQSIPRSYLQVLETNLGARAMYEAVGFDVHHRYDYWCPVTPLCGQNGV